MQHAIETRGLTRTFGAMRAVDDVALDVPPGSVYGFLGLNGAGKTTTIRLLLGLLRPGAGSIHLLGHPLATRRVEILAQVGCLVETPSHYPHLTGRENLEVIRRIRRAPAPRTSAVLSLVGLADAGRKLVRDYSLGMKQRLGIAQCLLGEPRLLILDEPTNGLDPGGIQEVRELVRRLPGETGATVFLSSHILAEIEQVATHIGVIHEGRLLFQGTTDSLLARSQTVLEIGVRDPLAAVRALSGHGWHATQSGEQRLILPLQAREDAARVNAVLVGAGQEVFHLAEETRSLERSFFRLIGAEAREEVA
jgi:ABC-2 type transport system ATP-binding protein